MMACTHYYYSSMQTLHPIVCFFQQIKYCGIFTVPSSPSPAELLKVYLLGRLGLLLLLELMMITNSVCYWCLGFLLSVTSPGWGDGFARRLPAFWYVFQVCFELLSIFSLTIIKQCSHSWGIASFSASKWFMVWSNNLSIWESARTRLLELRVQLINLAASVFIGAGVQLLVC